MNPDTPFDVVIIGSGAGGGTLVHELAATGKKILILERGEFVPREKHNWSPQAVLADERYHVDEMWTDDKGNEFKPGTHYFVGGNTKFYGAILLRMRERDFGEIQHVDGISPAWPISYSDMEPYYSRAEDLYHVHGIRGEDPTDPWASRPYPHPPVSHELRIQQIHDDLKKMELRPFHTPVGIQLDEKSPQKSLCMRCDTCDGFPCMVNAKSDADVLCVRPALKHSNITLLTKALVTKLETSATGREVSKVHVLHNGAPITIKADIVVVSCGAINSAALLLRSADEKHPNGLANSSGALGRHYMCHNNSAVLVVSKTPNPTLFQKTLGINDFYFGAEDWKYPLGRIGMIKKSDEVMLRLGAPKFAPRMVLDQMAKHSVDFWLTTEDLPRPDSRVTIDSNGKIRLSYTPSNIESHNRLLAKLKGMLKHIGCDENHFTHLNLYLRKNIPLAGVAHQCGTIRFGSDPKTSVLDVNCKAHDVDNLYVVDGSFFPSSSSVNPALTIMANAVRVAGHLTERLNGKAAKTKTVEMIIGATV